MPGSNDGRPATRGIGATARLFLQQDESSQFEIVACVRTLEWPQGARLLARCYPFVSHDVRIQIADACAGISGAASKSLLKEVLRTETDPSLRWVAINSLTALTHLRLEDMDRLYEIAASSDESTECRETAIYGLLKAISWHHRGKRFDVGIWTRRLPGLRECVRDGEEDWFQETIDLLGKKKSPARPPFRSG